eukprot:CAMPEP_0173403114 /NCGR_PEP_ID=MMETSP1356-20130122/55888_1 /TAXON_ID=77927 ORGANISM="Hemiselmis virescens, Strain PCC157" /NCGR_SAMPLE_ID=MMETSP1356 /ASSEMBLY_ACC=CAM_ASM_000847 /LENGTH=57 /DNA_ID=CAMNT_0014363591 /DNA_START=155 /DNA_END=328 /DNA_ORIENTATION=-
MTDADSFSRPPPGLPDDTSGPIDPEAMLEIWHMTASLSPEETTGITKVVAACGYSGV